MQTPITAIVPTYNRCVFLIEALESLLAQTRPLEAIIVWDDGSSDATTQVVAAMQARTDSRIRYFRSANGGKARALNAALQHVADGYVWICDDDDICRPGAAARLAAALDANPEAGAAAGTYRRFSIDARTGALVRSGPGYWPDLSNGSILRHVLEDIFLFQNATLVRREVYARVGPFREDLARSIDYDMLVRIAARTPILQVEGVLFDQRKHPGDRGPAGARHGVESSESVWLAHDQRIFHDLRETLPLSLYEAMFTTGAPQLARRAALIQRAAVYGRRNLWEAAAEDLEAAAAIDSPALTPVEVAACRRAVSGKHGCTAALHPEMRTRLAALSASCPVGEAMARALARGVLWRLRRAVQTRALAEARALTAFVTALCGPAGLLQMVATGGDADPATPQVAERRVLPAQAYDWTRDPDVGRAEQPDDPAPPTAQSAPTGDGARPRRGIGSE